MIKVYNIIFNKIKNNDIEENIINRLGECDVYDSEVECMLHNYKRINECKKCKYHKGTYKNGNVVCLLKLDYNLIMVKDFIRKWKCILLDYCEKIGNDSDMVCEMSDFYFLIYKKDGSYNKLYMIDEKYKNDYKRDFDNIDMKWVRKEKYLYDIIKNVMKEMYFG